MKRVAAGRVHALRAAVFIFANSFLIISPAQARNLSQSLSNNSNVVAIRQLQEALPPTTYRGFDTWGHPCLVVISHNFLPQISGRQSHNYTTPNIHVSMYYINAGGYAEDLNQGFAKLEYFPQGTSTSEPPEVSVKQNTPLKTEMDVTVTMPAVRYGRYLLDAQGHVVEQASRRDYMESPSGRLETNRYSAQANTPIRIYPERRKIHVAIEKDQGRPYSVEMRGAGGALNSPTTGKNEAPGGAAMKCAQLRDMQATYTMQAPAYDPRFGKPMTAREMKGEPQVHLATPVAPPSSPISAPPPRSVTRVHAEIQKKRETSLKAKALGLKKTTAPKIRKKPLVKKPVYRDELKVHAEIVPSTHE